MQNLAAWLTTVVGRVCLDMLRTRTSRREDPFEATGRERAARRRVRRPIAVGADPEQEAVMADSVGLALLVVLETLPPAERLAFVLHDVFAVPFDEIAPIVDRTPTATRQLASRARRRVQGRPALPEPDLVRQRAGGRRLPGRGPRRRLRRAARRARPGCGAARRCVRRARRRTDRGAGGGARRPPGSRPPGRRRPGRRSSTASPGIVVAPAGHLRLVLVPTIEDGIITELDVIADPERLAQLELAVLD